MESFPANFKTKLIESVKSKSFPFLTPVDPSSLELRAWEGMNQSRLHLSLGFRVVAFFFLIARWSSSCQLLGVLVAESLRICFNTFLKFHLTWSLLEAGVSIMRKSRFNECSKIIESIHVVFYIRNHFIRKSASKSQKIKKKSKKLGRLRYKYP